MTQNIGNVLSKFNIIFRLPQPFSFAKNEELCLGGGYCDFFMYDALMGSY